MNITKYYSIPQAAKLIGVSRIYLYNQIKKGNVEAIRIGRNFAIAKKEIDVLQHRALSSQEEKTITEGVKRVVHDYGDVLKQLGDE